MKRNRKKGKVMQKGATVPKHQTHQKRTKVPIHRKRTTNKAIKSTRSTSKDKVKKQVKRKMKVVLIAMVLIVIALATRIKRR